MAILIDKKDGKSQRITNNKARFILEGSYTNPERIFEKTTKENPAETSFSYIYKEEAWNGTR